MNSLSLLFWSRKQENGRFVVRCRKDQHPKSWLAPEKCESLSVCRRAWGFFSLKETECENRWTKWSKLLWERKTEPHNICDNFSVVPWCTLSVSPHAALPRKVKRPSDSRTLTSVPVLVSFTELEYQISTLSLPFHENRTWAWFVARRIELGCASSNMTIVMTSRRCDLHVTSWSQRRHENSCSPVLFVLCSLHWARWCPNQILAVAKTKGRWNSAQGLECGKVVAVQNWNEM